jgi:hypothetical protein
MAIFENPNSPLQPQKGVYGWYAQKEGQEPIPIYIGMAGQKKSFLLKGTLFRGISELQRNTFTSNAPAYTALDTDFIVGTAIIYFERNGYTCVWKHLSNDPAEENNYVETQRPLLQNGRNANIRNEFRINKTDQGYWHTRKTEQGVIEAESAVFAAIDNAIAKRKSERQE